MLSEIYNVVWHGTTAINGDVPRIKIAFDPDENNKGGELTEHTNAQNERASNILTVDAVAIDDVEECADATFIKMDVEGAEMDTLIGAYNTIAKNRPKLAICLYHSDEDMIRLIEWVHENFRDVQSESAFFLQTQHT
jgi:FkbM family methyltransferase